jgi:hypothetical protein
MMINNPEDFWDVDFAWASHDFELLWRKRSPIDAIDVDVRPSFLVEDIQVIDTIRGEYRVSDER